MYRDPANEPMVFRGYHRVHLYYVTSNAVCPHFDRCSPLGACDRARYIQRKRSRARSKGARRSHSPRMPHHAARSSTPDTLICVISGALPHAASIVLAGALRTVVAAVCLRRTRSRHRPLLCPARGPRGVGAARSHPCAVLPYALLSHPRSLCSTATLGPPHSTVRSRWRAPVPTWTSARSDAADEH